MSTAVLESVITRMFPPNTSYRAQGWITRAGQPVQIEYEAGFDKVGHAYLHEVGTGRELEMTPLDAREDLYRRME